MAFGTLKTALSGATTSVVITAASGVTFVNTADLVIGSTTTVDAANVNTATNSVSVTGTLKLVLINRI